MIAHFLLHKLLTPLLVSSARKLPPGTVRCIWVSSIANVSAPSPTGINWDDINDTRGKLHQWTLYGQSKAGDIILGYEAAQRLAKDGVVSLALSPGSLKTPLQRHMPSWQTLLTVSFPLLLFFPPPFCLFLYFMSCTNCPVFANMHSHFAAFPSHKTILSKHVQASSFAQSLDFSLLKPLFLGSCHIFPAPQEMHHI